MLISGAIAVPRVLIGIGASNRSGDRNNPRSREFFSGVGNQTTAAWAAALDMMAFELPHFIMERRMMLRIKKLAEAQG